MSDDTKNAGSKFFLKKKARCLGRSGTVSAVCYFTCASYERDKFNMGSEEPVFSECFSYDFMGYACLRSATEYQGEKGKMRGNRGI